MSASPTAIPLGDVHAFGRRMRTVFVVRLAVAVAVLVLAALCLFAVSRPSPTTVPALPVPPSGIVVLDMSASISSDTYARVEATLDRLAASNGSYGLVLFSDTAYETLPPGTPAAELRPIARFFGVKNRSQPGRLPEPPKSPFTDSFSAGTRISTGLALALDLIRDDPVARQSVLLVSDLDDDTGDLGRLARVALAYRRAAIPLHVVGLNASPEDAAFVRRLAPAGSSFTSAALPSDKPVTTSAHIDWRLVAAAVLLALGLGVLLVTSQPLRWRSS